MLIFIVELMGATTTLLWGVNIILDPVNEPLRQDPDNPGLTIVSFCCLIGGCPLPNAALTTAAQDLQQTHSLTPCPEFCAHQYRHITWNLQQSHGWIRVCLPR